MRVYLAARFTRQAEMRNYRAELQAHGLTVTSRWLDEEVEGENNLSAWRGYADNDIADVTRCDVLIAFTEVPYEQASRGGRHYETGYADALGKQIVVIGPIENVFHTRAVARHESWADFLKHNSMVRA